jgi:membrane-associated phospholipid phosphatase
MVFNNFKFSFLAVILVMAVFSCSKDTSDNNLNSSAQTKTYSGDVSNDWYTLILEIDRYSPGYRPPAASRAFGYMGLAAYETVVAGIPEKKSLETSFPGLVLPELSGKEQYHWGIAVNACYASMMKSFYPHIHASHKAKIDAMEDRYLDKYSVGVDEKVINNSVAFGQGVALRVFNYSETDVNGHEAFKNPRPSSYIPPATGPNGEKLWQPTYPDYTPALFPYWGQVRPFALKQEDKVARPPIPWSEDPNSMFYNQAKEIQIWVNNSTDQDKWIAEFWSDDIFELTFEPAARIISLALQMSKEQKLTLDQAAELYAKLGMSICDAGIAVWHSKYLYNVERPVSYIRRNMDPNWKPILNNPLASVYGMTPEFPAYPSGHSGFAGAGTGVLADFFGNNNTFTDVSHMNRVEFRSEPRTYTQILDIGIENAYSRLPLGVHYRMDCDEGIRLGYLAAKRVLDLPWYK